jgi:hypothetical protein
MMVQNSQPLTEPPQLVRFASWGEMSSSPSAVSGKNDKSHTLVITKVSKTTKEKKYLQPLFSKHVFFSKNNDFWFTN